MPKPKKVTVLKPAAQLRKDNARLAGENERLLAEKTRLKMQIAALMTGVRDIVTERQKITLDWSQAIYGRLFPEAFAQGVVDSTRRMLWNRIMEVIRDHGDTTTVAVNTVVTNVKEPSDGGE